MVMEFEDVTTQQPPFFFKRGRSPSAICVLAKKFNEKIAVAGKTGPTPALQIRPSIPSGYFSKTASIAPFLPSGSERSAK